MQTCTRPQIVHTADHCCDLTYARVLSNPCGGSQEIESVHQGMLGWGFGVNVEEHFFLFSVLAVLECADCSGLHPAGMVRAPRRWSFSGFDMQ